MGHYLNFGAGPNQLPEPWQNLNVEHDIRKPLKFENESTSAILAEHVIEHVPFLQGFGFLQECWRVLEPRGVLRLAFPDVSRFVTIHREMASRVEDYADALAQHPGAELVRAARFRTERHRAALMLLLTGWHHQSMWTLDGAAGALLAVGFLEVSDREYGKGTFGHVDGHAKDVGDRIALAETSILEAVK